MANKCPNMSHPNWVALTKRFGEDATWALYIKNNENIPNNLKEVANLLSDNSTLQKQLDKENNLIINVNNAIIEQLNNLGVGVGVLTDFEKSQGFSGTFDPTVSVNTATGIAELIRISQDNRGAQSLPEEFAHLVDAVLQDSNNPIYDRLTSMLRNPEVVKEVFESIEEGSYDRYNILYKGNVEQLAGEARAKLIAKHIIKNEEIKQSPWQTLMQRLKNLFKSIFSRGDANNLQYQIYKADEAYGKFAADLMGGQVEININLNSLRTKNIMRNASQSLSKAERALKKIIETEHKRLKIFESNKRLTEEQQLTLQSRNLNLNRLENKKNQKRFDEGILDFLGQAHEDMNSLIENLDNIKVYKGTPTSDLNTTAKFLRDLKSYISAYKPIVKELTSYIVSKEYKNQNLYDVSEPLKDLNQILRIAEVQYNEAAMPLFKQFISQFTGKLIGKTINGKKITEDYISTLLAESDQDISFLDRWLFSMAESSDLMLRLIERPVKNARFQARKKSDDTIKQLQYAQENLEKAGYKTDFIYERNDKGELTGKYIQELDWTKFYEAKNAEIERLDKKYGDRSNSNQWWKEFYSWRNANMEKDGESDKYKPNKNKYNNSAFAKLTIPQKVFYDKIIGLKKEVDMLLPDNKMNPYLLPQIRKDFLERLKESKDLKEARRLYSSHIADAWISRESDDEFGVRYGIQDFDGTRLNLLPVYYNTPIKNMNDLSTDIVSSMAMYADMAYNYDAMNKIVDIMEVGRDLMINRNIDDTIGGKPIMERFKREGRTIENKVSKRKGSSRFIERLQDYYEAQIYGQTSKDQGSWKLPFTDHQISIAKAANNLNQLTALNTYAINLLSGVSNLTMGKAMMKIEAASKEFFDYKDLLWADTTYGKQLPEIIAQIGRRRKTGKLDLLMIKFNVLQDADKAVRELEMNKKNIFSRLCNQSALFFLNNAGEHFMQTRTFLALASRYKLKDASGNIINLWDAYEVQKGEDGIERAEIKKGVTKLDGSEFTDNDVEAISRKSARINQKMHGIYNKEDMNAFQRTAQGRMVMMFRKWIVPSLNRRFQGENYSFDLDEVEEGYYRSTWNFVKVLGKDLMDHKFNMATRWKELNNTQRANVLRSITEAGQFIATILAFAILSSAWDGDDDWYKSFTLYEIRRLQTEMGALVPGPQMFQEGLTLLKSPAAGVNYIQNLMNVLYITDLFEDPISSGQYEGWNRYGRNVVKVLPFNNTIRRAFAPEEALKFYQLSR